MKMVPLGDICEFKYGKSLPKKVRETGPFGVFGSNGQVDDHSDAYTDGPTIIVGRKGSIGEVAFSSGPCWPIDTTYYIDSTATDQDPRWLFYALKSLRLQELNKSAAIPGLNRNDAYAKKIPLPLLEEQKRIAGILDQADALRRLRTRALDKLGTLGQAIFYEMFGDPSKNPMGWDEIKLGELCGVGSSKRVFVSEFVEDGVPFYRGTEVGKLGTGQSIHPDLFISEEHYKNLAQQSGKPEIGDLLLPSICHDGRIWKVDSNQPFYFKDGRVLWIKSHSAEIDSEYLRNQLRNLFLHNYNSIASGTTFAELKIVNLKNLNLLFPPMELQRSFASRIEEVQRQQLSVKRSEIAFSSVFASLQHRAFRGDL